MHKGLSVLLALNVTFGDVFSVQACCQITDLLLP